MPGIKVVDIAYGRLRSPDLGLAEEFLTNFGMVCAARTKSALYMRGTDPDHHVHVTELGEPKFIGLAFEAASEEDLRRAATLDGASAVEAIDEPGGGRRVRLTDPLGYQVEIVHGIEKLAPLPVRRQAMNDGLNGVKRAGELMRVARGPSQVKRIGHGVMMSTRFPAVLSWYRESLGLISSDDIYVGERSNVVASFNRCDRGEAYVDHHVFFCMQGEKNGLNHLSFEVQDVDDVMVGHEHMKAKGYTHVWGIGRHVLGSQIYDYWQDPWGRVHEHWTDSDRLNASNGSNLLSADEGLDSQWGEPIPETFMNHASP